MSQSRRLPRLRHGQKRSEKKNEQIEYRKIIGILFLLQTGYDKIDATRQKSFQPQRREDLKLAERNDFMARKDNKGRNLRNGENQRADGRYMYRYLDEMTGKRVTIYDTDLASLRKREKEIEKDLDDQLLTDSFARKMTLNSLFERYMATKELKERTRRNYLNMWKIRVRDEIGNIRVVQLKASHIRVFYSKLSKEGLKHNTIKYLHTMIFPALEMAVNDDIIRKNPAKGVLEDYGEAANVREALTVHQQERLLKFVANSKTYSVHLPMIQIMLGTACRCGEIIALTWSDINMKTREVTISGALTYHNSGEGYQFHSGSTKTEAGLRTIPMTDMVYEAFKKQRELNFMLGKRSDVEIGDRKGFIFLSKNGRPLMPEGVNSFLRNIVNAYNRQERKTAERENREPELMPHISAHILRHTGCTRMAVLIQKLCSM